MRPSHLKIIFVYFLQPSSYLLAPASSDKFFKPSKLLPLSQEPFLSKFQRKSSVINPSMPHLVQVEYKTDIHTPFPESQLSLDPISNYEQSLPTITQPKTQFNRKVLQNHQKNRKAIDKFGYQITYQSGNVIRELPNVQIPMNTQSDPMTYMDIDAFINIVKAINNVYDRYYQYLPDKAAQADKTKVEVNKQMQEAKNSTNATQDASNMKYVAEVTDFYSRTRSFIQTVLFNRDNLIRDLNFIEQKSKSLKPSQDGMLKFFVLDYRYNSLKSDALGLPNGQGEYLRREFDHISSIHDLYELDVDNILDGCFHIARLNEFFQSEVMFMSQLGYRDGLLNSVDKYDKVAMFVIRMLELKGDIHQSLVDMERSLLKLKEHRFNIEGILMKVERELDLKKLENSRFTSAGLMEIAIAGLLMLMAL